MHLEIRYGNISDEPFGTHDIPNQIRVTTTPRAT